jgi:hypothetical protein
VSFTFGNLSTKWRVLFGPKSDAGKRNIPVPEQLHKILAPVIADRVGLAFGDSPTKPFSRDVVVGRAEKVWREAGIDPAQFPNHDPEIHGEISCDRMKHVTRTRPT